MVQYKQYMILTSYAIAFYNIGYVHMVRLYKRRNSSFFFYFFYAIMFMSDNSMILGSLKLHSLRHGFDQSNRVVFRCIHRPTPSLLDVHGYSDIVLGRNSCGQANTLDQSVELSVFSPISNEDTGYVDNPFDCDTGYLALLLAR